jgi:hypothetical protein
MDILKEGEALFAVGRAPDLAHDVAYEIEDVAAVCHFGVTRRRGERALGNRT